MEKLTAEEGFKLFGLLRDEIGIANCTLAAYRAIGQERIAQFATGDFSTPLSHADTLALFQQIFPLIPGETTRAKLLWAMRKLRIAVPDKARFDAVLAYIVEKVRAYISGEDSYGEGVSSELPEIKAGRTISGWGPVNMWWTMSEATLDKCLRRMQYQNVRYFPVEAVGNAGEDVLANSDKYEQVKSRLLFCARRCHELGIWFAPILSNDNAGNGNYQNGGVSIGKRLSSYKEFADWIATSLIPYRSSTIWTPVGEVQTDAGRELERYVIAKLGGAGFRIHSNGAHGTPSSPAAGAERMGWHPQSVSSWPSSKDAVVLSDCGTIIRQLNLNNDLNGNGNPVALRGWLSAGALRGQCVVACYAFQTAIYDEAAIDAMSMKVESTPAPVGDDVDLSNAIWHGPNGSVAKVTQSLSNLRMNAEKISYTLSQGTDLWGPRVGEKQTNMLACFFVFRGGRWQGGKWDHSTYSRKDRETTNIYGGYTGGIIPTNGEAVRVCMLSNDLKERTNAPEIKWVSR